MSDELDIQGTHGNWEATRALQGIQWAGTNLPEELLEVEKHLREMIDAGYSYRFMEGFLMQCSYGVNVIRRAFETLTGLKVEDAVNYKYIYSPGNIPQINLGWGYAKKGNDVYFVMPMAHWYMVFCQKEDKVRLDVSKHATIMDAIEALGKLVKKVERWDPPVDPQKTKIDMSQLYKQPQLFMHASNFRNLCERLQTITSSTERILAIDKSYANGSISKPMREALLTTVAEAGLEEEVVKSKLQKMTDEAMAQPIETQMPRTPQEGFNRMKTGMGPGNDDAYIINEINQRIGTLNEQLKEFDVTIDSHEMKRTIPNGMPSPSSDEPDVMNASHWVAMYLRITDKASGAWKPGLMTFEVIGNDVSTSGVIKGIDDRKYAPDDQGLADYFAKERAGRNTG